MELKYVGTSDIRVITKADWAAVDPSMGGPIDNETVQWDASNQFVTEVGNKAAEFLLQYDPEFKHPTATDLKKAGVTEEKVKQ